MTLITRLSWIIFFFCLEYFNVMGIRDEVSKMGIVPIFLQRVAQLWYGQGNLHYQYMSRVSIRILEVFLLWATLKKKQERDFVGLSKWVAFATTSTSSLLSYLRSPTYVIKTPANTHPVTIDSVAHHPHISASVFSRIIFSKFIKVCDFMHFGEYDWIEKTRWNLGQI